MPRSDALAAAISMLERPHAAKLAWSSRLPEGVTFLLEIAAGEAPALGNAAQLTGRTEATLQKAAGFFIEQVLLSPDGDSYRILGSDRGAPLAELRRNMALIMRWLHPDLGFGCLLLQPPGQEFLRQPDHASLGDSQDRRATYGVQYVISGQAISAEVEKEDSRSGQDYQNNLSNRYQKKQHNSTVCNAAS